jgi:hypothetical protein
MHALELPNPPILTGRLPARSCSLREQDVRAWAVTAGVRSASQSVASCERAPTLTRKCQMGSMYRPAACPTENVPRSPGPRRANSRWRDACDCRSLTKKKVSKSSAQRPTACRGDSLVPSVFNTHLSGRTGRVRYQFTGPVRPETGRNRRNSNFKSKF